MTEVGEAFVTQHEDGSVTVERADPVIRVSRALLLGPLKPEHFEGPDSRRLVLDTAGEYVYEYLGPDPDNRNVVLYRRAQ